MSQLIQTVVGIDVGGERKGFHAVVLRGGTFVDRTTATNPTVIVDWCLDHKAVVVAIDAPCKWSQDGSSRLAERELMNRGIWCFSTPTKQKALLRDFYKWMLNGEKLYECLKSNRYNRYNGERTDGLMCIETFPHAIVRAIAGPVSAKHKLEVRRKALQSKDYDVSTLTNIDFVDAALCAISADEFHKGNYQSFGNREEGFIIVPACRAE